MKQLILSTPGGTQDLSIGPNVHLKIADGQGQDDALANAIYQLANRLQDELTRVLTLPWPQQGAGRPEFADPHSEIRDGVLYVWYGDESSAGASARVSAPLDGSQR